MPVAGVSLAALPAAAGALLRRPSRRVVVAGILPLGLAVAVTAALAFGPGLSPPGPAGGQETLQPSPVVRPTQAPPEQSPVDQQAGGDGDNEGNKDGKGKGKGGDRGRGGGGDGDGDDD